MERMSLGFWKLKKRMEQSDFSEGGEEATENFKWQPYMTTLPSTSLWTFYGLLKPDGLLVVTVNGTGIVLQAIYVVLYLFYAPRDTRISIIKWVGLLNAGLLGVVILVALLALHGNLRLLVIGSICAALIVGMYGAPLFAMRLVMKTNSVEYMPFSLSFFLFLNAGIWSIYAGLVRDYFMGVPNINGFVLGSAQLVIYFIYKRKAPSGKEADLERAEDCSTHLVGYLEMQSDENDGAKAVMKHFE